jgi:hypothetical protein
MAEHSNLVNGRSSLVFGRAVRSHLLPADLAGRGLEVSRAREPPALSELRANRSECWVDLFLLIPMWPLDLQETLAGDAWQPPVWAVQGPPAAGRPAQRFLPAGQGCVVT